MIGRAGQWTQTPSTTPLQLKTWNACFCITFNIWCWPGCSMDSNPICHPLPPKKWNAHFWITFNFWWLAGWLMDSNPIHHPSSVKKWNPHFWITFNFWWSARLVNGLEPHLPPLSGQKNEMLIFGLCSTSDYWPGWSMDSNPICHPSPTNKMKSSFLEYIQLLMISLAGQWTRTPSASPLQPKKWNATFWITFNFWWSAWLVDGLEPHLPALSSQKNEMLIFWLCSLQMISQAGQWTQTPSTTRLQPIKWNAWFWITLNFWWLAGLVVGLEPHLPPLSSQKMKSSFLDFVQLLMISRAVRWTQTPSATPFLPKKWNAHFWIMFNFWWLAGLVDGLEPPLPPLSTQKYEMLVFV